MKGDLFLNYELPAGNVGIASYLIEINACAPGGNRDGIINAGKHFFIDFCAEKVCDKQN
jgi:hypothetical protein